MEQFTKNCKDFSLDRHKALTEDNRGLKNQLIKIIQEKEVLHNCWQSACTRHLESEAEVQNLLLRVRELRTKIDELEARLNRQDLQGRND